MGKPVKRTKRAGPCESGFRTDLYRILDTNADGVVVVDMGGKVLFANKAALDLFDRRADEFLDRQFGVPVAEGESSEIDIATRSGKERTAELRAVKTKLYGMDVFIASVRDITGHKTMAARQELAIAIFRRLNGAGTGGEIIRDILALVRRSTGLAAAGIRVKAGEDYPYYVMDGFTGVGARENKSLCSRQAGGAPGNAPNECLCDRVIRGLTDPALPFFTKGGSFWTNSATDFLAAAAPEERLSFAHNRCAKLGYESVALVPLRSGERVLGLLQLNDKRRDRFTPDMIEFFEGLGASIAIALDSRRDRENLEAANKELRKTRDELALALAAKSEFLANMSHELRTPLNSIIGFSEVLQDGAYGPLNGKQEKYVSNILSSGRGLLSLINDILSLARLESGDANIETAKFGLAGLLEDTLALFKEKAMKHNIALLLDAEGLGGGEVETDRLKLQQALVNIISNAVKYTPDGGKVEVKAAAAPGGLYEISVTDSGIGMKQEDLSRLFSTFHGVESVYTKRYAGAGAGLAIAKKLAELLGGTVSARSEEGKGSRFTFTLPAKRP